MIYGDFKDLTRRTASDKIVLDKAFNIAKNTKNENNSNKELAQKLHKPINRKFKKMYNHLLKVIFWALVLQICN